MPPTAAQSSLSTPRSSGEGTIPQPGSSPRNTPSRLGMYEVLSQGGRSSCQLAAQLSVGGNTARATRRIGVKSVCADAGSRDDWVGVGRRRQFAWESFVNGGSPRTEIIFDFRHKAGNACSLTAYVTMLYARSFVTESHSSKRRVRDDPLSVLRA